jgi:tetratricopeptide (TPR) repeat protein
VVRGALVAGALVSGLVAPSGAHGQLARRTSSERILMLNPLPGEGVDSAYVVAFGDAFRERMTAKYRFRLNIVPTETICEALEASGFNCRSPLGPEHAPALARFLQATGFAVGWLEQGADSLAFRLRMVDVGRSGLSGWERFTAPTGTVAPDFARAVTDGLDSRVRVAETARECSERRERGDPKGAADRAARVFEIYPNHPSAAMCLALVHELARNPLDSIIAALQKAVLGDSLNPRAWEDLGRRLQDRGDTLGALDAFRNQLRADPTEMRLRQAVAAGLILLKRYAEAVEVLDEGLAMNPGDMTMLGLKEQASLEGQLWVSALIAMESQYGVDANVADSIFFQKIFGAAQIIPDTAAMLRWSGRAVEKYPGSVSLWRARAAALKAVDDRAAALDAYDRLLALDSSQVASALAAVQYLLDSTLVIDTVVPLDTARLLKGERLLDLVASQLPGDTATLLNGAYMILQPASAIARLPQLRAHLPLAARLLEKALEWDLRGALRVQGNFFLGLAYAFQFVDGMDRLNDSKSCDVLGQKIDLAERGFEALTVGRAVHPPTADRFLPYLGQMRTDLPKFRPVWNCRS